MEGIKQWLCDANKEDITEINMSETEGYKDIRRIVISIKESFGGWNTNHHTPAQAREMAAELIRLADEIEDEESKEIL